MERNGFEFDPDCRSLQTMCGEKINNGLEDRVIRRSIVWVGAQVRNPGIVGRVLVLDRGLDERRISTLRQHKSHWSTPFG